MLLTADHLRLMARYNAWQNAQIMRSLWAEDVRSIDLTGNLTWYSGAQGARVTRARAVCVVHMFNHQTHHRGQVHAMLTRAGLTAPVTDLVFMPEEATA